LSQNTLHMQPVKTPNFRVKDWSAKPAAHRGLAAESPAPLLPAGQRPKTPPFPIHPAYFNCIQKHTSKRALNGLNAEIGILEGSADRGTIMALVGSSKRNEPWKLQQKPPTS